MPGCMVVNKPNGGTLAEVRDLAGSACCSVSHTATFVAECTKELVYKLGNWQTPVVPTLCVLLDLSSKLRQDLQGIMLIRQGVMSLS